MYASVRYRWYGGGGLRQLTLTYPSSKPSVLLYDVARPAACQGAQQGVRMTHTILIVDDQLSDSLFAAVVARQQLGLESMRRSRKRKRGGRESRRATPRHCDFGYANARDERP